MKKAFIFGLGFLASIILFQNCSSGGSSTQSISNTQSASPHQNQVDIPTEVQPLLTELSNYSKNGVSGPSFQISDLIIKIVDQVPGIPENLFVPGSCVKGADQTPIIYIDKTKFHVAYINTGDNGSNYYNLRHSIFHLIAHCILNKADDFSTIQSGDGASYPAGLLHPAWRWEDYWVAGAGYSSLTPQGFRQFSEKLFENTPYDPNN